MKTLTKRHRRAADLYLANGGDQKAAAEAAGFATDQQLVDRLFASPPVREYLRTHRPDFISIAGITPDIVVDIAMRIGGLDKTAVYNDDGTTKPASELDAEVVYAITEMSMDLKTGVYSYKFENPGPFNDLLNKTAQAYSSHQRSKSGAIFIDIDPQDLLV